MRTALEFAAQKKENAMDKLTTDFAEFICDKICMNANNKNLSQEELKEICANCKMAQFIIDICNKYNGKGTWVQCDEKMPDESGWYLVKYKKIDKAGNQVIEKFVSGFTKELNRFWIGEELIAWMEIPD